MQKTKKVGPKGQPFSKSLKTAHFYKFLVRFVNSFFVRVLYFIGIGILDGKISCKVGTMNLSAGIFGN